MSSVGGSVQQHTSVYVEVLLLYIHTYTIESFLPTIPCTVRMFMYMYVYLVAVA